MSWLWYVLIGLASGIISGMGIGGGALLIPALGIIFSMGQAEAQKINLLYFLPTALIAICSHVKSKNIEAKGITKWILLGLVGAVTGATIALRLDANWLRKGFALFLLGMSAYEGKKGWMKWNSKRLNR